MFEHQVYENAMKWVQEAGELIRNLIQSNLNVQNKKSHSDLVTMVDLQVETFFVNHIRAIYPDHNIIGEENVAQNVSESRYTWIIDPIDGTTNMINRKADFAVSIAFCEPDRGIFGIVYAVMNDKLYYCFAGEGAYMNKVQLSMLPVNNRLEDELLSIMLPWSELGRDERLASYLQLIDQARGIRIYGATTIELCEIAEGLLGAYVQHCVNAWDYAASRVILEELGCRFTDLTGQEISWTYNGGILAASPTVHEQLVSVLNEGK